MPNVRTAIRRFLGKRPTPVVGPDDPVTAAVAEMLRCDADCALVVDGSRLVGIFTERDYLNRVVAEGLDAASVRMSAVMTRDPESLRPDDPVSYAINRMALGRYRNVPIVDEAAGTISVLGVRDVIRHISAILRDAERHTGERLADGDAESWIDLGGG